MFSFLDGIRMAGDELIDGLFWLDTGVLGGFLLGALAIILHILWGLLVYSSPLWIPLLIYLLLQHSRRQSALQQLANAISAQLVKDFAAGDVQDMAGFGAFIRRGNCRLAVTPQAVRLSKPGLDAVYERRFAEFKFELAHADQPDDAEMRRKVLQLAKILLGRLGGGLELLEHAHYGDNYSQLPVQKSRVVKDVYGREVLETRTEFETRGTSWVNDYWVEIRPIAAQPAAPQPQPKSDIKVI